MAWLNSCAPRRSTGRRAEDADDPDEEWRFTDISPLTRLSFQPLRTPSLKAADIERFHIAEATTRLVFVDGVYAPELSDAPGDGSRGFEPLVAWPTEAGLGPPTAIWAATRNSATGCSRRSIPPFCATPR